MPFQIPEALRAQLLAFRELRRKARAERRTAAGSTGGNSQNFIDSIRRLFSGEASIEDAAEQFVRTMDSWEEEIEAAHDAFLLYAGMGPMLYLTADGRILEDSRGWDGDSMTEVKGHQANAALFLGAKKTGIPDLINLIPPMPTGGRICPRCNGTRMAEPVPGFGHDLPCIVCESRGWVAG